MFFILERWGAERGRSGDLDERRRWRRQYLPQRRRLDERGNGERGNGERGNGAQRRQLEWWHQRDHGWDDQLRWHERRLSSARRRNGSHLGQSVRHLVRL